MKNNKLFQYIVIGVFVFFIIIGAIMFSTYRSSNTQETNISIKMWGILPGDQFSAFTSRYFNNLGVKYNVNYTQRDPLTFDRDLVEALASGSGPDAIVLSEDLIVRYANKIYPIPYATLPELTFKQSFIQEGELFFNNNGILALPFTIDPLVMYWNRDIFNNFSLTKPPQTWAEIINLSSKLTKKDSNQNILSSTVALGEFKNVNNAKAILAALMMQAGNPIVSLNMTDGSMTSVMKGEKATLPLQFFTNFSNPSRAEYSWNRSLPNSVDAFANGDLAIYFGFASEFTTIKNKNPNLNFDVAVLPQALGAKTFSTFGKMLGFAIMKNSSNPGGTYVIISTLAKGEAYPFWKDLFNIPSARRDILGLAETSAVKTVFNKSVIMSRGWLDPDAGKTSTIFQEMVESYTTGRNTLEDAVVTASDRLDSLLK